MANWEGKIRLKIIKKYLCILSAYSTHTKIINIKIMYATIEKNILINIIRQWRMKRKELKNE